MTSYGTNPKIKARYFNPHVLWDLPGWEEARGHFAAIQLDAEAKTSNYKLFFI